MKTHTKIAWGMLAVVASGAGFLGSFSNQWPRRAWASPPGQAITLAAARTIYPAAKGTHKIRPGDAPPAVDVMTLDGAPAVLAVKPGRRTLINFWATWCPPCQVEMPYIDAAAKGELAGKVDVIGVAVDEELPVARDYLAQHPVSYPMLWSAAGPASAQAKLGGGGDAVLPYSVLVGEDGRIEKMRIMDFDNPADVVRWVR